MCLKFCVGKIINAPATVGSNLEYFVQLVSLSCTHRIQQISVCHQKLSVEVVIEVAPDVTHNLGHDESESCLFLVQFA